MPVFERGTPLSTPYEAIIALVRDQIENKQSTQESFAIHFIGKRKRSAFVVTPGNPSTDREANSFSQWDFSKETVIAFPVDTPLGDIPLLTKDFFHWDTETVMLGYLYGPEIDAFEIHEIHGDSIQKYMVIDTKGICPYIDKQKIEQLAG